MFCTDLWINSKLFLIQVNRLNFSYNRDRECLRTESLYCHHIVSVMQLGHLLTRSDLTYPDVSSKVCHDSFCQSRNSVSLPWVIYYEAFYLHVVSSFSCIPAICPTFELYLTPSQFLYLFCNLSLVYPAVLLMYFISAAVILLPSLVLTVHVSLPYNRTGRPSVLYNFIVVFLRVFCWSKHFI